MCFGLCRLRGRKERKRAIDSKNISSLIGHSISLPSEEKKSEALKYFIRIEQSKIYSKELRYFNERKLNPEIEISFPENSKISGHFTIGEPFILYHQK